MARPLTVSQGLRTDPRYRGPEVLELAAFRSWLELHCYQPVGDSASECACPLARWLSDLQGVPFEVGYNRFWPAGTSLFRSLPPWAQSFIVELDVTHTGGPVTGQQALSVLDACLPARPRSFLGLGLLKRQVQR